MTQNEVVSCPITGCDYRVTVQVDDEVNLRREHVAVRMRLHAEHPEHPEQSKVPRRF